MSGGERKKRLLPHGAKGWEEAGGEFYQESYPGADSADSDLEVLQTDPHRISTLLPSTKTRTGELTCLHKFKAVFSFIYVILKFSSATMKRDVKLATLRHRSTLKSHYQTAIAPNNEIQISLLPDLSGECS